MNLMSEGPNAISNKLQASLTSLKQFLLENIQRINNVNQANILKSSSSTSPSSLKPIFESIQFDPATSTANGDAISKSLSGSVGISKEFIQNNRKQIVSILSRLLGLTFSAAISYFLFKWLMKNLDPTNADKLSAKTRAEKILKEIGLNKNIDLNEYELCIASNIVLPTSIECSWQDIGGLEHIINDLRETVIYPLKNFETELSSNVTNLNKQQIISKRSRLIQPPKGKSSFSY
jgi:SpoVK/Ycf46/Vps4 family AAA+-type ATPase